MTILNLIPRSQNSDLAFNRVQPFRALNRLIVHTSECIRCLNIENIEYLKADSNYTYINLITGEKLLVSKTLKSIWEQLDNTFVRTHKSYIVNLRHIKSYNVKDSQIKMISDETVQVSRAKKATLKDLFS